MFNRDIEKQPSHNERAHHRPKHLNWMLLAAFLLVTFLSVVITGVVAFANDTKNNNRHQIFDPLSPNLDNLNPDAFTPVLNPKAPFNLTAEARFTLGNFDPDNGLTMSAVMGAFTVSDSARFVSVPDPAQPIICFFIADELVTGANSAGIPSFTLDVAAGTLLTSSGIINASVLDGSVSRYPFDAYTMQLFLGAFAVPDVQSFVDCATSAASNIQNVVRFQAAVGQGLQGFSASFDLEPRPGTAFGEAAFTLTLHVKRDGVLKFFAVVTFMITWFLTLMVIIATGQVILYHKEPKFELVGASTALLFALPQIRASQPGIPDTPTLSDMIGYYWAIALLGVSTGVLIGHAIWQLRREKHQPQSVDAPQLPYQQPSYGVDLYGAHKRSFSTSEMNVQKV